MRKTEIIFKRNTNFMLHGWSNTGNPWNDRIYWQV